MAVYMDDTLREGYREDENDYGIRMKKIDVLTKWSHK
jgi:hypothetical protein